MKAPSEPGKLVRSLEGDPEVDAVASDWPRRGLCPGRRHPSCSEDPSIALVKERGQWCIVVFRRRRRRPATAWEGAAPGRKSSKYSWEKSWESAWVPATRPWGQASLAFPPEP